MEQPVESRRHAARAAQPRRRGTTALLAVNVALVAALAWVEFGPVALAQVGADASARPRGEYTLVGGEIQTGNSDAVYVIDSVNQEMVVLRWVDGQNILDGIGYRDLDADVQGRPRR